MRDEVIVEILGCGDAFASGGRLNTCFYVKSSSFKFLIDCGATSLLALKKSNIRTTEIDLIAISHFHGDHFGGLPFFFLDASVQGRVKPLTIVSPPGCEEKLRAAIDLFYPGSTDVLEKFPVEYISYQANEKLVAGDIEIVAFPVIHTEETLPHGLRISFKGRTIGFSGDTSWTDELFSIAEGADLFICECNFYDLEKTGHLSYQTIKSYQSRFSCKHLLLTHFGEGMLEKIGEVDIDFATDGRKIIL